MPSRPVRYRAIFKERERHDATTGGSRGPLDEGARVLPVPIAAGLFSAFRAEVASSRSHVRRIGRSTLTRTLNAVGNALFWLTSQGFRSTDKTTAGAVTEVTGAPNGTRMGSDRGCVYIATTTDIFAAPKHGGTFQKAASTAPAAVKDFVVAPSGAIYWSTDDGNVSTLRH